MTSEPSWTPIGSDRAALFGWGDGAAIAAMFAASHPERVTALIGGLMATQVEGGSGSLAGPDLQATLDAVESGWGQGQGANVAMADALDLAELVAGDHNEEGAAALEREIVRRGRKAVLASRGAARQYHATSRVQQVRRDLWFRTGNFFIGMGSR